MKYLAIEKEVLGADWSNTEAILKEEAKSISELYLKGIVREIYFNEEKCAVVILECSSPDCAKKHLNDLPLVKAGLITFEITELKPYTGFSRLYDF